MKELLKSYHVFLPQIWIKVLLYLIYPVAVIWVSGIFQEMGLIPIASLVFCCSLIFTAEILFDFIVFGGIASKDTNKLEYLKTSVKGMDILKKSIIADGIRRSFSIVIILGGVYIRDNTDLTMEGLLLSIFGTLFFVELGLIITRSFPAMGIMMVVIAIGGMVLAPLLVIMFVWSVPVWGIGLAVMLYVLAFVTGRCIIMKKARGSYYDSRD